MAFDISSVGAEIVFSNPNLTIDEFSDEGSAPILMFPPMRRISTAR